MSGECDRCGWHTLECICDLSAADITKKLYDKNNEVKYSIYEGSNRFYGTPIPNGYEAVYVNDGICPDSLQLRKINDD